MPQLGVVEVTEAAGYAPKNRKKKVDVVTKTNKCAHVYENTL
jgi:hypothetical protein